VPVETVMTGEIDPIINKLNNWPPKWNGLAESPYLVDVFKNSTKLSTNEGIFTTSCGCTMSVVPLAKISLMSYYP
jgi:hypothetical protein